MVHEETGKDGGGTTRLIQLSKKSENSGESGRTGEKKKLTKSETKTKSTVYAERKGVSKKSLEI